ncbi:unnamed protein product [Cuscuta epithymum]|uniref:Reverse transcriptase/retrotransposon-derived protein RNase H-like domain-containing protein n=1 Tax=Cuscuta epithymum TaxID=186058 RepID=A0AAV0DB82_9ASTE|nr:unnamed protein product [Cuscuta epithymum]CAH9124228.1 unnamed protein product [Cuscuta epithymum]
MEQSEISKHIYTTGFLASCNTNRKEIQFDIELFEQGLMPHIHKNSRLKVVKWVITSNADLCLSVDAAFQHKRTGGAILRYRKGTLLVIGYY